MNERRGGLGAGGLVLGALLLVSSPFGARAAGGVSKPMPGRPSEKPALSAFTTRPGRVYALLEAGRLQIEGGSWLGVFHAASSRDKASLEKAADDLFESTRLVAERLGQSGVAVAACFKLSVRELERGDHFDVMYSRGADGGWRRRPDPSVPGDPTKPASGQWVPRSNKVAVAEGRKAADAWLSMLDRDLLEPAWSSTSNIFKKKVPLEEWRKVAPRVRGMKGRVVRRSLLSVMESDNAPETLGAASIVFDFVVETDVINAAVERVGVVQVGGGGWQVFSYGFF